MVIARILVVLSILLVVVSLLAGYIRFQALDNDTVTNTAGELIADDEIRTAVAAALVDELYTNVDVAAALEQRLPPDQKGLAGPAAAGLRELSDRAAVRMLERPRVQDLWVNTVSRTHRQLLRVLEDDTGALSTEGGAVVLDLQPLVVQLGDRIAVVGNLAEQLGPDAGRIEIMQADQLETAQDLTQLLKFLGSWLWILPIALMAVALWLARGRRLFDPAHDRDRLDPCGVPRPGRSPARRLVSGRGVRADGVGQARGAGRLGHPHLSASRRRSHVGRAGRDRARGGLAGGPVPQWRRVAALSRAVPGAAGDSPMVRPRRSSCSCSGGARPCRPPGCR